MDDAPALSVPADTSLRERRLRLTGLPRPVQLIAGAGVWVIALLCVWIVLLGFGFSLPGSAGIPGLFPIGSAAHMVVVLWLAGLALGAALLASVVEASRLPTRLTLVTIALFGAAIGSALIRVDDGIRDVTDERPSPDPLIADLAGWAALGIALAIVVVPVRMHRFRWLAPALAAMPFVLALLAYALAGGRSFGVSQEFIAAGNTHWENTVTPRGVVAHDVVIASLGLVFLVAALLLWQVVEITRGWNEAARASVGAMTVAQPLLIAALALKFGWMGLGYADALPSTIDSGGVWLESRADGVLAWVIGAVFVVAAVALLLGFGTRRWSDEDFRLGAWLIGSALVAGPLLAGVYFTVEEIALVGPQAVAGWLENHVLHVAAAERWLRIGVPYAAFLLGVALVVARRATFAGAALVLFALWGLPRAVTLTSDAVRYPDLSYPVGQVHDFVERDEQFAGWTNAVTIDSLVTVTVAGLAVLWMLGKQRRVDPGSLLYVLLFSTAVAHASALFSTDIDEVYFLLLVFPVAYAFLLDSAHLNVPSAGRATRVLVTVALTLLVLSVASLQVGNRSLFPGQPDYADLGLVLAQTPLAVLLLLISVVPLARAREYETEPSSARDGPREGCV